MTTRRTPVIYRNAPESRQYRRDPLWERTTEFERAVARLLKDPTARLKGLTDDQRVAVEAEAWWRRWPGVAKTAYRAAIERGMNATRPQTVAPSSDTPTPDVVDAWLQPEGRDLYERIISARAIRRSSVPSVHFSAGVLLATGAMRQSPHILENRDLLLHNGSFSALVSELALGCEGIAKCEPEARSYEQVIRNLPRLAEGLAAEAHVTFAEIATQLLAWDIPVGRHVAADGSLVPAWVPQRSARRRDGEFDESLEAALRSRTPDAGFRVYSREYQPEDMSLGDYAEPTSVTKAVRGYMLTSLVDICSGTVLAFDLRDATKAHEPKVMRELLLPTILELSPQLDVVAIVGDGKYDDNPTHEYLETRFGVHLIAGRGRHAFTTRGVLFPEGTDRFHRSVASIDGFGVATCRAHDHQLPYVGLEAPSRDGKRPGDAINPRLFRSRFHCSDGCGKVSVPTQRAWSNLPYYPHTPYGRLDLFAMRRALLHRRNQVEAAFSSLQVGYKQGLDGAVRVRVFDRSVTEALMAISFVTRGLVLLLAERRRRGEL
jgi:hypothetical protein